jgi:hypothetical protein
MKDIIESITKGNLFLMRMEYELGEGFVLHPINDGSPTAEVAMNLMYRPETPVSSDGCFIEFLRKPNQTLNACPEWGEWLRLATSEGFAIAVDRRLPGYGGAGLALFTRTYYHSKSVGNIQMLVIEWFAGNNKRLNKQGLIEMDAAAWDCRWLAGKHTPTRMYLSSEIEVPPELFPTHNWKHYTMA